MRTRLQRKGDRALNRAVLAALCPPCIPARMIFYPGQWESPARWSCGRCWKVVQASELTENTADAAAAYLNRKDVTP